MSSTKTISYHDKYDGKEDGTNVYIKDYGTNLTFTNNRITWGEPPLRLNTWSPATMINNKIVGSYGLVWGSYMTAGDPNRVINNNTYHYPNGASGILFQNPPNTPGYLNFAGWKQSIGGDANSTFSTSKPTGTEVFVRPNQYEPGRAHVIVYNWDMLDTITIDLSAVGLTVGQQFELRDAQNYLGSPVYAGTYNNSPVTINVTNLNAVSPLNGLNDPINQGSVAAPTHTSKEFNAFVVIPR